MKKYKTHIIWAIIAIIALVGGFFWGKAMVPTRGTGAFAGIASGTRGGFGGRTGAGGGFVAGQVASVGSSSMIVDLPNGNSEVVYYSGSTQIIKPSPAVPSDLQPGTMVMIGGTTNSDGSVTAQSIQIRNGSSTPGGLGAPRTGTAPAAGQ